MPGPVPLDEMKEIDPESAKPLPVLHPSRVEKMVFVRYLPPPESSDQRADYDAWMERVAYLCDDLHWLLQQPHHKFWCQTLFDDSLHKALDSFLHQCPRSTELLATFPVAAKQRHQELCRLIFMVYLRMSTHKESKENFLTQKVFGDILYNNYLFDVPKMLDLCSLYGKTNMAILNKMLTNIFTQQPKYMDDLRETLPTISQVFSNIASRCGVHLDAPGLVPQKLEDAGKDMGLSTMSTEDLKDIVLYLNDTATTLHRFLDVYPAASQVFADSSFCPLIANFYECVHPELTNVVKQHSFDCPRSKKQLTIKLHLVKKSLMAVFHDIVNHTCLQPVLENASDTETVTSCVERFLHIMTSVLGERRFLAAYEGAFIFQDDVDLLRQACSQIDASQFEYIQSAINSAFATFGHRKSPRGDTNTGGRTSPDGAPDSSVGTSASAGLSGRKASSQGSAQAGGGIATGAKETGAEESLMGDGAVSTPRPSEVEIESLISSVKDIFSHLGDGFIEMALEELAWNSETVVSSILEDKLPPSLQETSRDMPRQKRDDNQGDGQVDAEDPDITDILDSRKNIFDNDEFDIFRKDVDVSRMHIGKKDAKVDLDDKSVIQAVKATYDAYGSMDKESMYDNSQMYEDEYDDTYDTNNVGAEDADSADELTTQKVLPRVLQELERKKARGEGRLLNEDASDDDDDDDSRGGKSWAVRDEFVSDPAKLREQAEMRRQSQMAHRGRKGRGGSGGGGGGGGPPRRDVVGGPKGQGQSGDVQHNRRVKEKHKGQRNRNMADKKMSKGMF